MQSTTAALPELEQIGFDAEPAPVRRAWDRFGLGEPLLGLGDQPLELGAIRDHPRLGRGPGSDLAAARATGEVLVGLAVVEQPGHTLHPHLPLEIQPQELRGAERMGREFEALRAVAVREEHEPR